MLEHSQNIQTVKHRNTFSDVNLDVLFCRGVYISQGAARNTKLTLDDQKNLIQELTMKVQRQLFYIQRVGIQGHRQLSGEAQAGRELGGQGQVSSIQEITQASFSYPFPLWGLHNARQSIFLKIVQLWSKGKMLQTNINTSFIMSQQKVICMVTNTRLFCVNCEL